MGWIAGGIVLALVLMFVFSNSGTNTNTAAIDNGIPPASTTNAPPRVSPPAATPSEPVNLGSGQQLDHHRLRAVRTAANQ